jgi:hypothetical protein
MLNNITIYIEDSLWRVLFYVVKVIDYQYFYNMISYTYNVCDNIKREDLN